MRSLVVMAALLTACAYPDIGTSPKAKNFGGDDDDSASSASTSTKDSGTTKTADANDPFGNAVDYQAGLPTMRAANEHTTRGAGVVPSYKQSCLSCHSGTTAPAFQFAGSVYLDAARTQPGKSVQIGLVDSAGQSAITTADADGNFWMTDGPALKFPVYAAVRDATGKQSMSTAIADANSMDCNSCHGTQTALTSPVGGTD